MSGERARWYQWHLNLRAALERRGEFETSAKLLRVVRNCANVEMIEAYIDSVRLVYAIPEEEVYGRSEAR